MTAPCLMAARENPPKRTSEKYSIKKVPVFDQKNRVKVVPTNWPRPLRRNNGLQLGRDDAGGVAAAGVIEMHHVIEVSLVRGHGRGQIDDHHLILPPHPADSLIESVINLF